MSKPVTDPVAREAIAILRGTDSIHTILLLDANGVVVARYDLPEPRSFREGDQAFLEITIQKG
jgi:hypothetical protein